MSIMGRLSAIVDPFVGGPAHAQVTGLWPRYGNAPDPVEIELSGEIQLEVVLVSDDRSPADVRRALYDRAEQAVAAVEADGWRHVDHPTIEIGGEIAGPDGPDPHYVTSCRIELRLWPPTGGAR